MFINCFIRLSDSPVGPSRWFFFNLVILAHSLRIYLCFLFINMSLLIFSVYSYIFFLISCTTFSLFSFNSEYLRQLFQSLCLVILMSAILQGPFLEMYFTYLNWPCFLIWYGKLYEDIPFTTNCQYYHHSVFKGISFPLIKNFHYCFYILG